MGFWFVRQLILSLMTLIPFWIFLAGIGFRKEHFGDFSMLWFGFILCTMSTVHLVQLKFRMEFAPPVYGIWCALQMIFCGMLFDHGREPAFWKWFVAINPTYYFVTTLLSLEFGVGEVVAAGEIGRTFLESRLNYWSASVLDAILVFFLAYVAGQYALIYALLHYKRVTAHAGYFAAEPHRRSSLQRPGSRHRRHLSLMKSVRNLVRQESDESDKAAENTLNQTTRRLKQLGAHCLTSSPTHSPFRDGYSSMSHKTSDVRIN